MAFEKYQPEKVEKISIAKAIELHDELEEDVDGLNHVINTTKDINQISARVQKVLTDNLEERKQRLERIHKAFNETKIVI